MKTEEELLNGNYTGYLGATTTKLICPKHSVISGVRVEKFHQTITETETCFPLLKEKRGASYQTNIPINHIHDRSSPTLDNGTGRFLTFKINHTSKKYKESNGSEKNGLIVNPKSSGEETTKNKLKSCNGTLKPNYNCSDLLGFLTRLQSSCCNLHDQTSPSVSFPSRWDPERFVDSRLGAPPERSVAYSIEFYKEVFYPTSTCGQCAHCWIQKTLAN